jgi:HrpA-like RNA helicase
MRLRAPRNGELGDGRGAEVNILGVVPISQEQAWQRAGRAGRTSAGKCFRLYPEPAFLQLPATQLPEIQRIELTSLILQLMVIGINDVVNFPYMSPPDRTAIRHALEQLYVLGALDKNRQITDLGRQMALFPLDPAVSKVLIRSKEAGVCEEIISIVALLSVENLFWVPSHKENGTNVNQGGASKDADKQQLSLQEVDMAKKTFAAEEGDHLFYLNVYNGYKDADDKKQWCKEHYVNRRSMEKALDVREQLVDYWENSAKWVLASDTSLTSEERIDAVRKTFLSGFFENVAILLPNGHYQNLRDRQEVAIHPSSILAGRKPSCVLYRELVLTSRFYMRDVLAIDQAWLIELAPHSYKQTVDASLVSQRSDVLPKQAVPRPNAPGPAAANPQPRNPFGFNFSKARPAMIL